MITNLERIIPLDGNLRREHLRNEPVIIPRISILTRRKLMMESRKIWFKNEKGKKVVPVEPLRTTPGENVENGSK